MSQPIPIPPKRSPDPSASRQLLVQFALANGIKASTRFFQTTRRTVRKWLRRYKQFGSMGLLDQSRAPHRQPRKTRLDLETRVIALRREHPTYGARRLIREFGLPVSHGAVERILHAKNLVQSPEGSSEQTEAAMRLAMMHQVFSQCTLPDDMECEGLTSQSPTPGKAEVGGNESRRPDVDVDAAALGEDLRVLLKELKVDTALQHGSKEASQGTEHSQTGSSGDAGPVPLGAAESNQAESRETSLWNPSPWNGPDDPKFIEYVKEQKRRVAYHSELAKLFRITQRQQELTDGQLAGIIADAVGSGSKDRESNLFAVIREVVGESFLARDLLPGRHYRRLVAFWSNLFIAGLVDEMDRREKLNEEPTGRSVRELIVEESKRPALLGRLAEEVAKRPSYIGERPEPSEDYESEALKQIWESVQCFISTEPPAANPEFLKANITGAFNKDLLRVRDHLWYQRECERDESNRTESLVDSRSGSQDDAPFTRRSRDRTVIEFSKRSQRQLEERILLEQLLAKVIIEDPEKKVIEFVLIEGHTQADAATELGISQSTVNRRLNSAIEKLRKELGQNTTSPNSLDESPNN